MALRRSRVRIPLGPQENNEPLIILVERFFVLLRFEVPLNASGCKRSVVRHKRPHQLLYQSKRRIRYPVNVSCHYLDRLSYLRFLTLQN